MAHECRALSPVAGSIAGPGEGHFLHQNVAVDAVARLEQAGFLLRLLAAAVRQELSEQLTARPPVAA